MADDETPRAVYPPAKSNKGLIVSLVIVVALVGGAIYWRQAQAADQTQGTQTLTLAQLATFDGVNGHKIQQGRLWQSGQHTPSGGRAECGKDLSEAITHSPHGKSILSTLTVVGTLKR
jgi:predicted heme/steroid binding protein